jgi:hypothetical protein
MSILPSIEIIDEIASNSNREGKIADYFGLGRKIIFEQKTITIDQADKIQKEIDKYQEEDYFPLFYGKRNIDQILKFFPEQDLFKRKIYNLITRLIEDYLSNSNKQVSSTEQLFVLSNTIGVLIILNDSVHVLSPEIIAHRVQHRLREKKHSDEFRFNRIQYVILISETHQFKGKVPLLLRIEGPTAKNEGVVNEYLDYLSHSWAQYNGGELAQLSSKEFNWHDFEEVRQNGDVPKTGSEARIEWYKQNRYLRLLSDARLIEYGARLIESITPYILKGGSQLPIEQLREMFFRFGDFIEETNYRGLDLKELKRIRKELKDRLKNLT